MADYESWRRPTAQRKRFSRDVIRFKTQTSELSVTSICVHRLDSLGQLESRTTIGASKQIQERLALERQPLSDREALHEFEMRSDARRASPRRDRAPSPCPCTSVRSSIRSSGAGSTTNSDPVVVSTRAHSAGFRRPWIDSDEVHAGVQERQAPVGIGDDPGERGKAPRREFGRRGRQIDPDTSDGDDRARVLPSISPEPEPRSTTTALARQAERDNPSMMTASMSARPTPARSSAARACTAALNRPPRSSGDPEAAAG